MAYILSTYSILLYSYCILIIYLIVLIYSTCKYTIIDFNDKCYVSNFLLKKNGKYNKLFFCIELLSVFSFLVTSGLLFNKGFLYQNKQYLT